MGYLTIRGKLGCNSTYVFGLNDYEKEKLFDKLQRGPKTEDLNEVLFFNPVMTVLNQLEYNFGYELVASTATTCWVKKLDLTMWTMYKADMPEAAPAVDHRYLYRRHQPTHSYQ